MLVNLTYSVLYALKFAYNFIGKKENRSNEVKTSILKVLLKQYKSSTGPNKFSRGITPVKEGQAWRNSNLMCIESKAINIQNFN